MISRRFLLGGLSAIAAVPGCAGAPDRSPRPPVVARGSATSEALVARSGVTGTVAFAVADASGRMLDGRGADVALPPASTAKAITALYALDRLGAGHRFGTSLVASGPVRGGIVQGDLWLVGGGDPTLDTDGLDDMAAELAAQGVRGVTGRFMAYGGALPFIDEIDRGQSIDANYNAAISGLNLNFNRVYFAWGAGGAAVSLDARSGRVVPPVTMARMRVVGRSSPTYTYDAGQGVDNWTVAQAALGRGGNRWLPVRQPDSYAGDVFRWLAARRGVALPAPVVTRSAPSGTVLLTHSSPPLSEILQDMLKYSNNMTAETVGLTASRQGSLTASGAAMGQWVAAKYGASVDLRDHSGLSGASRVAPSQMVRVLVGAQADPAGRALRGLMKDEGLFDAGGREHLSDTLRIKAKTGTLSFASGLVGYASAGGTERVFAILSADLARRDAMSDSDTRPAGSSTWIRNARILQSRLIETWVG
ncbi:D-alanyl-D-alanine carboxypeptidase/D-alanyl-D-alanine-endopeptidase [Falsirhodobacter algicola]|uniref:D-alanyl-D-alanine carboxypeptidase/D-alanyl-D-alanine-endopeptidase n=1 Tax=Falsirhodobacter algicola TaxID=2692330 RepID=A0A8J8MRD8_9RHOB|nr:D-alanyl-D-alanine carboxypeptidase/D-alanyl-D-alanine-endopeptidase [Falsirhodobacter algicola]QUS35044.1 D-alanyl-D-alanine carboxypeptidase/D-alanyl-D-alanine-endopeptidase [Falsirhodobacter algicola]